MEQLLGVWAEPGAQDLGEAVSVVAWGVDDVQGDRHELGFVGDAFDLEGCVAGGSSGCLSLSGRKIMGRLCAWETLQT